MSTFSLTAANEYPSTATWRSVPISALSFPSVPNPYAGEFAPDFWLERYREYNGLRWHELDWARIRASLARTAAQLKASPSAAPTLELGAETIDERMFLEMWFGYGDPTVKAARTADGLVVRYGQHRICALADFPLSPSDCALLRVGQRGFVDDGPLPADTALPILVIEK